MTLPLSLQPYSIVLAFVLGTVFGSFINCLAWRWVQGESVLRGRSHCAVCGHVLGPLDLIPLVSYLALKGRCRYCSTPISPRYMAAEVTLGLFFAAAAWRFGLSWQTVQAWALFTVLLGLALVDLDSYIIPDGFILAGLLIWLPTLALAFGDLIHTLAHAMSGAAMAALVLGLVLVFEAVTKKESMGGGDIKLFFMVGLYLGFWESLLNLILACLIGIVFAGIIRARLIPFGPAIALATALTLLFGGPVVDWYLSLFM